jgi:hypothetical protein
MHDEQESAIICGDVAWVAGQTVRSTRSPVNPGRGRRLRLYKEDEQMAQQSGKKKSPTPKGSKKQKKQTPAAPKQPPTASK